MQCILLCRVKLLINKKQNVNVRFYFPFSINEYFQLMVYKFGSLDHFFFFLLFLLSAHLQSWSHLCVYFSDSEFTSRLTTSKTYPGVSSDCSFFTSGDDFFGVLLGGLDLMLFFVAELFFTFPLLTLLVLLRALDLLELLADLAIDEGELLLLPEFMSRWKTLA